MRQQKRHHDHLFLGRWLNHTAALRRKVYTDVDELMRDLMSGAAAIGNKLEKSDG